jgi:hypothetical protein
MEYSLELQEKSVIGLLLDLCIKKRKQLNDIRQQGYWRVARDLGRI